jgi:hypothetical protein
VANHEKRFSEPRRCGHCANTAPAGIVSEYSGLKVYEDERTSLSWDAGHVYQLVECPACGGISLRRYYWHSDAMDPSEVVFETLYPSTRLSPRGLPEKIATSYESAAKVRGIDPNAYAVLVGRVLELICEDRGARGNSLAGKLKDLATRGEVPQKLVDVADGLRQLRNLGAHAFLGELTGAEVPVLEDLTRAILEYVYTAPLLAREAEERLKALRMKQAG